MNITKVFFIIPLMIFSVACFATADDEERELNAAILAPIMGHFPETSSKTKLISNKIKAVAKAAGFQLNRDQAITVYHNFLSEGGIFADEQIKCVENQLANISGENDEEVFAKKFKLSWQHKVTDCTTYAYLVLAIFDFNQMNLIKQGKEPILRMARLVIPAGKSGDHIFVLVEGMSGTMFAIDPWIGKVVRLEPNFIKLSIIPNNKFAELNSNENSQLNHIFSIPYYDVLYVNSNTKWLVEYVDTNVIHKITHTCNEHMKEFYTYLQNEKANRFPQIVLKYKSIMPSPCRKPAETKAEKSECTKNDSDCKK